MLETNPDNSTAITTLFEIIRTTQEEEVRWRAIESLPKNARHNLTDLIGLKKEELRLANHPIKLTVSAIKISDEQVSVFIKLYPAGEQTTLPIGMKLIVLDESGEIFDQVPLYLAMLRKTVKLNAFLSRTFFPKQLRKHLYPSLLKCDFLQTDV